MTLYQNDNVKCPCSCSSFLSKADGDSLKPLFADSTMSALLGLCVLIKAQQLS